MSRAIRCAICRELISEKSDWRLTESGGRAHRACAQAERGYVIRVLGIAAQGAEKSFAEATWILDGDPNFVPEGTVVAKMTGIVSCTSDISRAKFFPSFAAASAWFTQTSTLLPVRPYDGRPNRPFTAYHVEFEPVIREVEVHA